MRSLLTSALGTLVGLALFVGWLEYGAQVERRVRKEFHHRTLLSRW